MSKEYFYKNAVLGDIGRLNSFYKIYLSLEYLNLRLPTADELLTEINFYKYIKSELKRLK